MTARTRAMLAAAGIVLWTVSAEAATIRVAAGGDLQAALDAAKPGDVILLDAGAEYVGNFVLPVTSGAGFIRVRSATADTQLPADGARISPSHLRLLPTLRSPNTMAAIRTAPFAHHWRLSYLAFAANVDGSGDVIQLGDGSSAQDSADQIPHDLILDHLYVHGDPLLGQKRGIALNAASVTIRDSYVSECKGVGMDTQAIAGWNGPGPFTIENNYLEAAGENVMFGGSDPAITDLVPTGITFRKNYLSRPIAWMDPIVPAPTGVAAAEVTGGGTLAPGTYAYRVIARRPVGQGTTGRSMASTEAVATVAGRTGSGVRIAWQRVNGATEYRVYGRASGSESMYWTVTGTEFIDRGSAGTAEAVPTSGETYWVVKNVFELKNARNVVVEQNLFENHWQQAQAGYAIVFTPRNSGGACTWCGVDHVTFRFNIVRNVAAGINLLGYDIPSRPTRQTTDVTIAQNLFYGVTTALGGNGWFLLIGDEPRDVTIEHNTIDFDGTTAVYAYGGTATAPRTIVGFRFANNALRHNKYGMNGASSSYGNPTLTRYFPALSFEGNWLQGGSAALYPSDNLFSGSFEPAFVDAGAADYRAVAGGILAGAATDGTNIGVNISALPVVAPAPPPILSGPALRAPTSVRILR
jgi:hypothetical protein